MWSGPRNLSTAMMRAWENRADTEVWDEPFYGPYLHATGAPHPHASEVIAAQGKAWEPIAEACRGPAPGGAAIFFQKHMTHHMLDHLSLGWMADVSNAFLIRRPEAVLNSYLHSRATAKAEDLGYARQCELVDHVINSGHTPLIIEASDLLKAPREMLAALCDALAVPFDECMLSWPAGPRDSDGVWAKHWYASVWASTGFAPYRATAVTVPQAYADVVTMCRPYYERLYAMRLRP